MKNLFSIKDWDDIQESQMIGEILIASGKINLVHLSMALDAQKFQKMQLGTIFKMMRIITQKDLDQALVIQEHVNSRIGNENN